MAALELDGWKVLELGCGLGLPALAAALRGAEVLATDWAEEAIELLQRNAERNGVFVRAARVRWSEPEPLLRAAPWDLVLGADLLYEAATPSSLPAPAPGALRRGTARGARAAVRGRSFSSGFGAEAVGERIYRLR